MATSTPLARVLTCSLTRRCAGDALPPHPGKADRIVTTTTGPPTAEPHRLPDLVPPSDAPPAALHGRGPDPRLARGGASSRASNAQPQPISSKASATAVRAVPLPVSASDASDPAAWAAVEGRPLGDGG